MELTLFIHYRANRIARTLGSRRRQREQMVSVGNEWCQLVFLTTSLPLGGRENELTPFVPAECDSCRKAT